VIAFIAKDAVDKYRPTRL